ncbi:hypothetical protein QYE76_036561 [Lolium multiflorum]|uniref:Reverse transcriptase Ty1/copia-type domain-containing protein n=1 Tax=Lolium multiflorum TaxID=4521 RepID=A0AAD8VQ91_LOLMU|nr:hypothetical protein QYE76_036561 [Lolium multiflorum]
MIRLVLHIAVSSSWPIRQLDVKNTFLHGSLDEVVYCQQSLRFVDVSRPNHVCRLHKSLYGLKQAPRAWYHRFASYITTLGFVASATDTSLFVLHSEANTAYLLLYVDDIIVTASSTSFLEGLLARLHSEFAMTDLGTSTTSSRGGISDCHPSPTPVDTSSKLSASDGELLPDTTNYRSIVGGLQYLTLTRPDMIRGGPIFSVSNGGDDDHGVIAAEKHDDVVDDNLNNYGNNNYRPYPPNNGNGYGNSYGNSYNNNKSVPSGLEVMLKEFISTQTAFNKTVEEKLGKIDILASKVDSLALDVDLFKLKVMPEEVKDARNRSKEIFLELDEINAQGPIFTRSFQKTEGGTKWGHEAPTQQGGAAWALDARPWCVGPSCRHLTYPSAYK